MATPDFRRCPSCGESDFDLKSEERLTGANRPALTLSDDGELLAARWGLTEPDWSSCVTVRYVCGGCDAALPEPYQAALDAALGNRRMVE